MYLYAGEPWKTQRITRAILARLYLGSEIGQGYPGDEDNGEMSAWYAFASLGLYPLRMGSPDYAIGSPLFGRAELDVGGGKRLVVRAIGNSPENVYVQSLTVDGKAWRKAWIPHATIANGATLEFTMGPKPSTWGSAPEDALPSLTPAGQAPRTFADVIGADARLSAGNEPAPAVADDDAGTALALEDAGVDIALASAAKPVFYTLTSGDRPIEGAAWRLQARSGQGAWKTVDTREAEDFHWPQQTRPFRIASPGAYDQYRLRFGPRSRVQLAEIELLKEHVPVPLEAGR